MTVKGVKITTEKILTWGEYGGLKDLQEAVGGWIEPVTLDRTVRRDARSARVAEEASMYINEEGKINGLPFNSIATDLALNVIFPGDTIRGDVVILGPVDGAGNDTDLDPEGPTVRFLKIVADEAGGTWAEEAPRNV